MNDFEALQHKMSKFVNDRDWNKFHTPKNLSMAIAIEAAELMEIFQWMNNEEAMSKAINDPQTRDNLRDEIADVIIYCLSLANVTNIDLKKSIEEKMDRNNGRFPVGNSLG